MSTSEAALGRVTPPDPCSSAAAIGASCFRVFHLRTFSGNCWGRRLGCCAYQAYLLCLSLSCSPRRSCLGLSALRDAANKDGGACLPLPGAKLGCSQLRGCKTSCLTTRLFVTATTRCPPAAAANGLRSPCSVCALETRSSGWLEPRVGFLHWGHFAPNVVMQTSFRETVSPQLPGGGGRAGQGCSIAASQEHLRLGTELPWTEAVYLTVPGAGAI